MTFAENEYLTEKKNFAEFNITEGNEHFSFFSTEHHCRQKP